MILAVGYAVMSLIYALIGAGITTGLWPVDLAIFLALQWVAFMFTISLLTTLYQKSVERNAQTEIVKSDENNEKDSAFYARWKD